MDGVVRKTIMVIACCGFILVGCTIVFIGLYLWTVYVVMPLLDFFG